MPDEYRDLLKLVLENADLCLLCQQSQGAHLADEQKERRFVVFGVLLSLFDDAYLLVYEEKMDRGARHLRRSCEDYMREWVCRADFRESRPGLLDGKNQKFTRYIRARPAESEVAAWPNAG